MRKILIIILLATAFQSFGQSSSWTEFTWTAPLGQRLGAVYIPAGYDGKASWPTIICFGGAGQRGTANMSPSYGTGLAKSIHTGGYHSECIVIVYQISTNEAAGYANNVVDAMWSHAIANYKVNQNKVYFTGLSLGATGVVGYAQTDPTRVAAYLPIAGAYTVTTSVLNAMAGIPGYLFHGRADVTQGISNSFNLADSLSTRNQALPVLTKFTQTGAHNDAFWNGLVYTTFRPWERWLLLHDKNMDTTALNYVDSLERSLLVSDYWRTLKLVNSLSSSAHKTSLLSRVSAVYSTLTGIGSKRWIIDLGSSSYAITGNINKLTTATTGTSYSSLITDDGTTTGVGLTVQKQLHTTATPLGDGIAASYFEGWHSNVYKDGWPVLYNQAGVINLTGLNNAKTYTIRVYGSDKKNSASYEDGNKVTIGGVSKQTDFISYNTTKYIEFTNLTPSSGVIAMTFNAYLVSGGAEGRVNAITLIEEGSSSAPNEPPTVSTGSDQNLTLPTLSASLTSSAADADGTIASRQWTKVSGPSASFSAATSTNTNATLTDPGSYVFRITVTDDDGATGFANTTVILNDTLRSITTSKDTTRPLLYSGPPHMGYNGGYYNANNFAGLTERNQALLAYRAGGPGPFRTSIFANFLESYGAEFELPRFKYMVDTLGMAKPIVFLGINSGAPYTYRDTTTYPGAPFRSIAFLNIYDSIWTATGEVNDSNYCAAYVKQVLDTYGDYIGVMEIVNEPDIPFADPASWHTRMPLPGELQNWQAPFPMYIRFLRIAWEVTQRYRPDISVSVGGLGFTTFLRGLGNYTDNPVDGSVTPEYPHTGLAYINVISWHLYPMYHFYSYAPYPTVNWHHNSDYYAKELTVKKDSIEANLKLFGYNGTTYPRKPHVVSEINMPRVPWSVGTGSFGYIGFNDTLQTNWLIKQFVQQHKDTIHKVNLYLLLEQAELPVTADGGTTELPLYYYMGAYENGNRTNTNTSNAVKTRQWYTHKTIDTILRDYYIDPTRTAALDLPAGVEGAAFKKGTEYRYVIWASTYNNDSSETASETYSFPEELGMANVFKYNWNYSETGTKTKISAENIALTGEPLFFSDAPNEVEEPLFLGIRDIGVNFQLKFMPNRASLTNGSFVALGSSTFAGTGATSISNAVLRKLANLWPSIKDYNIAVGAQGGADALPHPNGTGSRNMNTAVSYDPTFIILGYPSNSVALGIADTTFVRYMKDCWNFGRSYGIPVFVTGPQPRDDYNLTQQNRLVNIGNLLRANFNYRFTNNFLDSLRDLSSGLPAARLPIYEPVGDDIHLNDSAHTVMARLHYREIDSFFFNRAEIYNLYEVEYNLTSALGTAPDSWLPFDNIDDCNITNKSYSRLGSGVYAFRYRARKIDGTYTNYSDTVYLEQRYQRVTIDQVIKVNLGLTSDTDASAPWNEVAGASGGVAAATSFTNLTDSIGDATDIDLTVTKAFSSIGGTGTTTTGWPTAVTTNGWQNSATVNTDRGQITLSGLTQGAYQIEILGTKNNATVNNRALGISANGYFNGAPIHSGTSAGQSPFTIDGIKVGGDGLMTIDVQSVGDLTNITGFNLRRYNNTEPLVRYIRFPKRGRVVYQVIP